MAKAVDAPYESTGGSSGSTGRIHYLDWLRLLAIFGVFLFHATRPFHTFGLDWHIVGDRRSIALTLFGGLMAQWIPGLLFLISGAAASMALRSRTNTDFIGERTRRLLVPFVVGALLFTPVQLFWERRHQGVPVEPDAEFVAGVWEGILHQPDIIGPRIFVESGLHLWFLAFLFVISVTSLPALRSIAAEKYGRLVDWLARLAQRRFGLLLFIAPLAISRFVLPARGPGRYDWADFVFLGLYFVFGALFFADARFLSALRRDRWILLAVALAADVVLLILIKGGHLPGDFTEVGTAGFFAGWLVLSAVTWCSTLVLLEAGRRFLDFSTDRLGRWTRGATSFYVLHQPVLIGVAFVLVSWDVPVALQFVALVLLSLIIIVVLIEGVRRLQMTRVAFGMKSDD